MFHRKLLLFDSNASKRWKLSSELTRMVFEIVGKILGASSNGWFAKEIEATLIEILHFQFDTMWHKGKYFLLSFPEQREDWKIPIWSTRVFYFLLALERYKQVVLFINVHIKLSSSDFSFDEGENVRERIFYLNSNFWPIIRFLSA